MELYAETVIQVARAAMEVQVVTVQRVTEHSSIMEPVSQVAQLELPSR